MHLVEIKNLSKIYTLGRKGEHVVKALDNVSLTIDKGEFIAIVGPSGSGKSTLLQILGLLDKPTKGHYHFLGNDVSALSDNQLTFIRSRYFGFVFQLFNLLPRLNTAENTGLPMIYQGASQDHHHVLEVLKRLGMDTHLRHTPAQLSGGQQQRVAIARALINRPNIILADEPTGNLPRKQAMELIELLKRLNQEEGITVILITHDDRIAAQAQRVIRIVDGKIESEDHESVIKDKMETDRFLHSSDLKYPRWNILLWKETVKMAIKSLTRYKIRTFLTMLGVIIGVFSVISMLAIGAGAKKHMQNSLQRIGSNMFRVQSQRPYSTKATKKENSVFTSDP